MVRSALAAALLVVAACAADASAPDIGFDARQSLCPDEVHCINRGVSTHQASGVTVIHKRIAGEPLVSVRIAFDGGSARWTPRIAYAEHMLMLVQTWWGSSQYATTWDDELSRIGAKVSIRSGVDYAVISLTVPAVHFVEGWRMLASAVVTPPIPTPGSEAMAHLRVVERHAYDTAQDDASSAANSAAWKLFANAHPYRMRSEKIGVVDSIDSGDLQLAQSDMLRKDRMLVVVVGDVERSRVDELVDSAFDSVAPGNGRETFASPAFAPLDQRAEIIDRSDSPTWYIDGYFAAPPPADPDYPALQLGLSALSARLFDEVRSARALVYEISISASNFRSNYGMLSLATRQPAEAMQAVHAVIDDTLDHGIDADALDAQRALELTSFYESNETPGGIAWTLLDWQLTSGDRKAVDEYLMRLQSVSTEDVDRALQRYVEDLRYGAAGSGAPLSEAALLGSSAAAMTSM
jgi:predicted Zn-dependent peptidase